MIATLDRSSVLEADGVFTRVFVDGEPPVMSYRTLGACEPLKLGRTPQMRLRD